MRVLVTGGAGFIGSHTVELLLTHGHEVRVLDNFSSGHRANLAAVQGHVDIVEGDIRDEVDVTLAMQGMDSVIHLAAVVSVPVSIESTGFAHSVNATGTLNVMEAARRLGARRLVYASSAAVYGTHAVPPVSEDALLAPSSPYGSQKRYNEEMGRLEYELHGLETVGLRYFNIYGPRQDPASPYSGVLSIFIDRLSRGQTATIFGDGQQSRDFVYVGDVARANVLALTSRVGSGSAFNVGTGIQTSVLTAFETIAALVGSDAIAMFGPERPGDIRHSLAEASRIWQVLGWQSGVSFAEGIARTVEWHQLRVPEGRA